VNSAEPCLQSPVQKRC